MTRQKGVAVKKGMVKRKIFYINLFAAVLITAATMLIAPMTTQALEPLPEPEPKPGSYGLEATKPKPPPTTGARITTPTGGSFSSSPITVNGICPAGLLVQLYNNNVLVGSVMCQSGSFSLSISLFAGVNELKAIVYDELDQAGPESNIVTVNYADVNLSAFGELLTLTSSYGRRSAAVDNQLVWPLQLSGGTGPYAFSIDWGDGSELKLMSLSLAGLASIDHVYKRAGIYQVNVRATDTNGVSAFLQLVAVSSGQIDATEEVEAPKNTGSRTIILWIPAAIATAMLIPVYWLGRRSQLVSLRKKMEKERDSYQKGDKSK